MRNINRQASLLDLARPDAPARPVFGVPASWLCFGGSLSHEAIRQRDRGNAYDMAAVSYCYLLSPIGPAVVGQPVRLQCPALDLDITGGFSGVWKAFNEIARRGAMRHGCAAEAFCCVTTAWQGETRRRIVNAGCAAEAHYRTAAA